MLDFLGNKRYVTVLLYSGSIHEWSLEDFHRRCDLKGPTISLFKVKDGDCIGGYTEAEWSSDGKKHICDNDTFLFNLSCSRLFPNKNTGKEIFCTSDEGPSFGINELCASIEPFNGEKNCTSYANADGFGILAEDGKNMLTNRKD